MSCVAALIDKTVYSSDQRRTWLGCLYLIFFHLNCPKLPHSKVLVNYRANSNLHSDKFSSDLLNSVQQLANKKDLNLSVEDYNTALNNAYSTHYPPQTRWVNHRPRATWFNQDLRVARREKGRLERMLRKSHLTVHRQLFMEACSRYNRMLDSVKLGYFKAKIDQVGNYRLFKTVHRLFTSGSPVLQNIYDSLESLALEVQL